MFSENSSPPSVCRCFTLLVFKETVGLFLYFIPKICSVFSHSVGVSVCVFGVELQAVPCVSVLGAEQDISVLSLVLNLAFFLAVYFHKQLTPLLYYFCMIQKFKIQFHILKLIFLPRKTARKGPADFADAFRDSEVSSLN